MQMGPWINACLKNIECVTELHEISIDDHGTRQGPYIGRHSLEQDLRFVDETESVDSYSFAS
ncbi:hypothetical protein Bca52824_084689 [Brassica carinata]|uniref:Uncharacterized protein n=2 Tax=Brassica TaxID=3705 RepID=A0A8X7PPV9_BRACI|nr:hypothetical protein Bca52824_084689 [Brassica carinata]